MTERETSTIDALEPPDLTLSVRRQSGNGDDALLIQLDARDPSLDLRFKTFGPIPLKKEPAQFFREFLDAYQDAESDVPPDILERQFKARGMNLFRELPDDLQAALWHLHTRAHSLAIISDEPWIPWELMALEGVVSGRVVTGPFFCEAFAMARWFPGGSPTYRLSLQRVALVMPTDHELIFTNTERRALEEVIEAQGGVLHLIPPTFTGVTGMMAAGAFDVLHFIGHGEAGQDQPGRAALALDDGMVLTPDMLTGSSANLGANKPLVFLNACATGRHGYSLTRINGWAHRFQENGAGAFIGTYWPVSDWTAFRFSGVFYAHLAQGLPIGEAFRLARERTTVEGNPDRLAFTLFADPQARVSKALHPAAGRSFRAPSPPSPPPRILIGRKHLRRGLYSLLFMLALSLIPLGLAAHHARLQLLEVDQHPDYGVSELIFQGFDVWGSLPLLSLSSAFSNHPWIRFSVFFLLTTCLTLLMLAKRPRAYLSLVLLLGCLAPVLGAGGACYAIALRTLNQGSELGATRAPGRNLVDRMVHQTYAWVSEPSPLHRGRRRELSGLTGWLLLTCLCAAPALLRIGPRSVNMARLFVLLYAGLFLFYCKTLPRAYAYAKWGIEYPAVKFVPGCAPHLAPVYRDHCVYDITAGARKTMLLIRPMTGSNTRLVLDPSDQACLRHISSSQPVTQACGLIHGKGDQP